MKEYKPLLIVFAGPNGSGKSTITQCFKDLPNYTNADDIKRNLHCTDLEAAIKADKMRNSLIRVHKDLSFETVLSSEHKLRIIQQAKQAEYFVKSYFVLTDNPVFNIARVANRVSLGGHAVPEEKIVSRYYKSLNNLRALINLSDICHVYDNTDTLCRIFSKKKDTYRVWENAYWNYERTLELVNLSIFDVKLL